MWKCLLLTSCLISTGPSDPVESPGATIAVKTATPPDSGRDLAVPQTIPGQTVLPEIPNDSRSRIVPIEEAPKALPESGALMKLLSGTAIGSTLEQSKISISGWTEGAYTASSARGGRCPSASIISRTSFCYSRTGCELSEVSIRSRANRAGVSDSIRFYRVATIVLRWPAD